MIGRFVKTDTEDWHGLDCCRLDIRGTDVMSPYFGDPSLWDEDGYTEDTDAVLDYIRGRTSLEGIILSGEPLRRKGLFALLKELRRTRIPIRLETWGTRPAELDDIAGAMMIDSVLVRLTASPGSPAFEGSMPGANPYTVVETLELLDGLEIPTEVEVIAVPGIIDADNLGEIASYLGKRTTLTLRQFNPRLASGAEAKELEPLSKKEFTALHSSLKGYKCKSAVRWV